MRPRVVSMICLAALLAIVFPETSSATPGLFARAASNTNVQVGDGVRFEIGGCQASPGHYVNAGASLLDGRTGLGAGLAPDGRVTNLSFTEIPWDSTSLLGLHTLEVRCEEYRSSDNVQVRSEIAGHIPVAYVRPGDEMLASSAPIRGSSFTTGPSRMCPRGANGLNAAGRRWRTVSIAVDALDREASNNWTALVRRVEDPNRIWRMSIHVAARFDELSIRVRCEDDYPGVAGSFSYVNREWRVQPAGTWGCSWPASGGREIDLNYSYGGNHRYLGNVFQAAINWTTSGTRTNVYQWLGRPALIHIPVIDVYDMRSDAPAAAIDSNTCQMGTYSRSRIVINQRIMDRMNDFDRTKTATHEFGHVLGLTHPEDNVGVRSGRRIMYQGRLAYNTPQPTDVFLVNGLYP